MNKQFKLVFVLIFFSIHSNAQEIINKIDFDLPNGIKAEDLINYEFNDTTKQFSLTFFKEINSKKAAIQLLKLDEQFGLVEEKKVEMDIISNNPLENESYSKLWVNPLNKALELKNFIFYPKKGRKKHDQKLQNQFDPKKHGIGDFKFLTVFRFKSAHEYETRSTGTGEYLDPSLYNCFYILAQQKNNLHMLKFNNQLELLKKIDLHINSKVLVKNLTWTPLFSFSETSINDSFELKYEDKENGFICRISGMDSSKKFEYSTLKTSVISHKEWDCFLVISNKRQLDCYSYSNFEKLHEHILSSPTKSVFNTNSTAIFCSIDSEKLQLYEYILSENNLINKNELDIGFDFDLDEIKMLNINENKFGVLIRERKEEPPFNCKFFILNGISEIKDNFKFQLEDNFWNPVCVMGSDQSSYFLYGLYSTQKNGIIKGVKIVRCNSTGLITNNIVSIKELKKEILFIRPPSEIGTPKINFTYTIEFVPSIEDSYLNNKGDFWLILNRQGILSGYLNKMFLMLDADKTKLKYLLIRNSHPYLNPVGFFFVHKTDPNRILYVQAAKKAKTNLSRTQYFFKFFTYNSASNKFESETTLEDDNCFFLPNNTREIFGDYNYFNGIVENGVKYTINTWNKEHEMIKFLPGENNMQVKLIGKQKGANTLQLLTIDFSNFKEYVFHLSEIENKMLQCRYNYALEKNYGLMHKERLLNLQLKVLNDLQKFYETEK